MHVNAPDPDLSPRPWKPTAARCPSYSRWSTSDRTPAPGQPIIRNVPVDTEEFLPPGALPGVHPGASQDSIPGHEHLGHRGRGYPSVRRGGAVRSDRSPHDTPGGDRDRSVHHSVRRRRRPRRPRIDTRIDLAVQIGKGVTVYFPSKEFPVIIGQADPSSRLSVSYDDRQQSYALKGNAVLRAAISSTSARLSS
ncbi:MAG: hypothetical protein MZU97_18965 [Bacillus subtilis]|nr:hypothetical protein [Bacillus subtilis]